MDLQIELGSTGTATASVYRTVRLAILDGRLRSGDPVPPSRTLAAQLGLSRNTVNEAYQRLVAEGYLEGRVGAGTFVTEEGGSRGAHRPPPMSPLRPRAGWTFAPRATSADDPAPRYDFRVGLPEHSLFPFDLWRRLMTDHLRAGTRHLRGYAGPSGHLPLREALCHHLGMARGVVAEPDDILITEGTQQALDLVGRVLLSPGDVVAVEDPGYPMARSLFASLGARIAAVPVDREGLVVEQLPRAARLVYVTPSHQFPLGTAMSLTRRRALLDWAARHGAAILEDDYDSEFRFSHRPLEPLHVLDVAGRVLYVGSFSKTLIPALRMGYLVMPGSLRSGLRAARQLSVQHGHVPSEAAMADYLSEGHLARHVRAATRVYEARRSALLTSLTRRVADRLEVLPSAAGLHVCTLFRDGTRAAPVVDRCRAAGIGLDPLSAYCVREPDGDGLVLGFGMVRTDRIDDGVARLDRILDTPG